MYLSGRVYMLAAILCPSVPHVQYASAEGANISAGSIVLITCNPGKRFSDGNPSKTTYCSYKGQWTSIEASCAGNMLKHFWSQ